MLGREALLIQSSPLAWLRGADAGVFSNALSLQVHTEVPEACLIPPHAAFSGGRSALWKPARSDGLPALLCGHKRLFVPRAGLCPPLSWLCSNFAGAILKSPGSHFCGRFHLVSQGLEEGPWGPLGTAPHSPTFGAIYKLLRRERAPSPERVAVTPPPHCLRGSGAFPQLTCLRVARCEKLETKMVSPDGGGAFLYRKEGNTSVGFYFFLPPLHPKNTKRLCL